MSNPPSPIDLLWKKALTDMNDVFVATGGLDANCPHLVQAHKAVQAGANPHQMVRTRGGGVVSAWQLCVWTRNEALLALLLDADPDHTHLRASLGGVFGAEHFLQSACSTGPISSDIMVLLEACAKAGACAQLLAEATVALAHHIDDSNTINEGGMMLADLARKGWDMRGVFDAFHNNDAFQRGIGTKSWACIAASAQAQHQNIVLRHATEDQHQHSAINMQSTQLAKSKI